MRRALAWYLPLLAAVIATATFGYGFVSFVRGDTGSAADFLPSPTTSTARPARELVPLVMGDSLARGAGDETGLGIGGRLNQELKKRKISARDSVNVAVNGARTADLLKQLDSRNVRTLIAQSNVIVVSIGGNDLWGGTDWRSSAPKDPDAVMGAVLDRIDQILKIVREANPSARVFLVGLYNPFVSTPGGPMLTALVNRWNGKLLERFGSDPNFTLVPTEDLFSHRERLSLDHFHPGGEGYGLIASRIAESL
jgi:lysophospholipase L1-like esterase